MNICVLGSGAREHALAWKIKKSPLCSHVFVHPGNDGLVLSGFESLGDISLSDNNKLIACAREKEIELIVIGPELLLANALSNRLREAGFYVVGANQREAQLETSKVFAKNWMKKQGIPTAQYKVFEDKNTLLSFLKESHFPKVLKYDGLAFGKGVVVASSYEEAKKFSEKVYDEKAFGNLPQPVVVEDFISGKEVSYIGLCDGETFMPFASCSDYKTLYKGGPNTGGMGAISPSPYFSSQLEEKIKKNIIEKILIGFEKDSMDYQGALYVGVMVSENETPWVLEFNARFGDPETQCLMLRLESDLVPYLLATAKKQLKSLPSMQWHKNTSMYVVASSQGYPETAKTGEPIFGLSEIELPIFYAAVKKAEGTLVTSGGRVLGVGDCQPTTQELRNSIYRNLTKVSWDGIYYRKDIGE